MMRSTGLISIVLALCATGCQQRPVHGTADLQSSAATIHAAATGEECPTVDGVKAAYVGTYRGVENVLSATDLMRDVRCAERFKSSKFPKGFVTFFGSSRITQDNVVCNHANKKCDQRMKRRHDALYRDVRAFSSSWTKQYGTHFPILAGAGGGLMEAANRGAFEAGGVSVGYTTYYDKLTSTAPIDHPYAGDPRTALNSYVTTGLIFTSIAEREAAMIRHSAAIVFAPGGTGTEWEIFQVLEMRKSRQLLQIPIYLFGERSAWRSLERRLDYLVSERVVAREQLDFIHYASSPEELVSSLAGDLGLRKE
ncbi:LOG family protein [Cupriavidus sp. UYPR2.512]|uniref:LOG family protein n=1 Tax=Cupriavidus sp. UYPR2.512 TaxID=1080187 RepID=UPI0009D95D33|nr:LOG family protein [Cupriavidus sp. UYPR2.512]UIF89309.1 LOG family protein [Cupriavidus necator]